jgi:hypothetical protein
MTPVNEPEVPQAQPTDKTVEDKPAQVDELPSLGSLLGDLVGQEAAQALDTPAPKEVTPEQIAPKDTEPLTYD